MSGRGEARRGERRSRERGGGWMIFSSRFALLPMIENTIRNRG